MTAVLPDVESRLEVVGHSVVRPDLAAKLSGAAEYTGDFEEPGMLRGQVLRSVMAHARILAIDTSAARLVPGVVSVITAEDLRDLDAYWGHALRDRPILADGVVRFVGEIVAAVAAETEAAATEAINAIDVEYERLPAVIDVRAAVADGATRVHPTAARRGFACPPDLTEVRDSNAFYVYGVESGDEPDTADCVVIEHEYTFPAVYQYAMEPHSVLAQHDGDRISLRASCQHPFLVREELAIVFGLPVDRVRIQVPFVGGGFGSKSYTKMEPVAVALARHTGRPVRLINTVADAMVTTRRHGMHARMRTVVSRDGRLISRTASVLMDTGAYADNGPTVTMVAGVAARGPYRWDHVRIEASCVYTHLPPAGSYRGFGAAHLQWVGESQLDEAARLLELDPLQLRTQNLLRRGETMLAGQKPIDADLAGDLRAAAERIGWGTPLGPGRGVGLSIGVSPAGSGTESHARVELAADGAVRVHVGTTEIGQGARSIHAQIAAEVLGVEFARVTVVPTDTTVTPYDRSTGASRSTTLAGLAVQGAAQQLRARLESGERPGEQPLVGVGSADEMLGAGSPRPVFWEVGVAAAQVRIEPDTGVIEVERVVTVADVGKAINPDLVRRQDEGCAVQALGNALFEQLNFDEYGALLNDSLLGYRIPSVTDLPPRSECIVVENADGPGPFGAKGCGEGVFGALPAALVNAVAAAGVQMYELPMTPDRVWARMQPNAEREGPDAP